MSDVVLRGVRKQFSNLEVIKSIDLKIDHGEFCVFVGPSGCGKSTLLRLIAGLEDVTSGTISIGGRDVTRTPPANRGIAMVFQSYALYPHMTVAENISFGLRMANMPKAEISARVQKAASMLQLDALLQRRPSQLSGGQRQRVAIGRAIVREPAVFLFDEPLSNLDAALRLQTRVEILNLHQTLDATMIYVTHDQVEAMTMADKIVVLQGGLIEQVGSPLTLYQKPDNLFVARFIGSPKMNVLPATVGEVADGVATLALAGGTVLTVPVSGAGMASGRPVQVGIRPEHIRLAPAAATVNGHVHLTEHLGSETILHVTAQDGETVIVRTEGMAPHRHGDAVDLGINPDACHVFGADGRALMHGAYA